MKSQELTTDYLLNLEDVGGVMSSGRIPVGLSLRSTMQDWYATFPNVDKCLLEAWADYVRSKNILEDTISILNAQK